MNRATIILTLPIANKSRAAYWRAAIKSAFLSGGRLIFSHRERNNVYNAARSMDFEIQTRMTNDGKAVEMYRARIVHHNTNWRDL
jgi:hypothetical protein